ncbi:MAG TPA: hypothetical protein PKC29_14405 [Thermodesulfobacteriota bacterium]|nr:hypothetical protein [Thermodesulfobacteriota bacterium]
MACLNIDSKTLIAILGAIPGIVALIWKIRDLRSSYLHISLTIQETHKGTILIKTQVFNKSLKAKVINNALLLISPEDECPVKSFNSLSETSKLGKIVKSTNEIAEYCCKSVTYGNNGRTIIPLPFYYSENVRIADENPAYTVSVDNSNFEQGKSYSVRFFLWGENRLHRTTQDCFKA